jgi:phage gpG-like protein
VPASQTVTLEQLAPWLEGLGEDLRRISWRRPLKAIALLLSADAKSNFEKGQSPGGEPWLPLKRPRANSKGGDRPLRDRGILMASLSAGAFGHVETITDTSLEWGSGLDYAALMNSGGTVRFAERKRQRPWVFPGPGGAPVFTRRIRAHTVTVPARPFVGLSDSVKRRIEELLAEEVLWQLGGRANSSGA